MMAKTTSKAQQTCESQTKITHSIAMKLTREKEDKEHNS
jgi:hypothetical protein